ncbi:MAG: toxin [Candidatus Omnitrophota bacterium]
MKRIQWDPEKNAKLKEDRGICFDEILACIGSKRVLDIKKNPSEKYEHQMTFIVELNRYIYSVPFVEDENGIFLKTIIPSRKLTKEYLKEKEK